MSDLIYKVIFKGSKDSQEEILTLTFKSILRERPINIPSQYFSTIKKLSDTHPSVINFQNIEEVLRIGEATLSYVYNYYIVVLYSIKPDQKKEGFLIGNVKKHGDILIGVWPFNENISSLASELILKKFDDLIRNPQDFDNICIIYS